MVAKEPNSKVLKAHGHKDANIQRLGYPFPQHERTTHNSLPVATFLIQDNWEATLCDGSPESCFLVSTSVYWRYSTKYLADEVQAKW